MDKSQALNLKDIHLPDPIGWWPLAPGWWVLVLCCLIGMITLVFYGIQYAVYRRASRQAIRLLTAYQAQYQREGNASRSSSQVSELLKRVALAYFPRAQVASLQGDRWILFLNESSKGIDFNRVRVPLLELPYTAAQQEVSLSDMQLLFSFARLWIKQRSKPCLS